MATPSQALLAPVHGRHVEPSDVARVVALRDAAPGGRARVLVRAEMRDAWRRAYPGTACFDPLAAHDATETVGEPDRRRRVHRVPAPAPLGGGGLILKQEDYPFPDVVKGLLDAPRAERELLAMLALGELGFPVVEPLAAGRRGPGPLYHSTFLATREWPGSVPLKSWRGPGDPGPLGAREDEIVALAADALGHLARLHARGWWLDTFQAKNLLVRREPDGRLAWRMCDTPRLRRHARGRLPRRSAARDVAGLDKWAHRWLDGPTRRALLRAYLRALGPAEPLREEEWIDRVVRRRERELHRRGIGRFSRARRAAWKWLSRSP